VNLFTDLAALTDEGRAFVLATVIASHGSTPQKPGAKLIVLDDGSVRGTVGGGALELQVVEAARALLASSNASTSTLETHLTHDLGMCCGGRMTVFLEKHDAVCELYVFGAGHVAKELAALATHVGFRVTVVDARPDWLTAERFPKVARRLELPDEVARAQGIGEAAFCCVVTHDHPLDQACVEALLPKTPRYLGVIGSRRKAERFRQRLLAAGVSAEQVAQVECPMGLDVGALTPAEIAVSIVARLIAVRRRPSAS
jgi:xanthine dehydrogenase accessory factor